MQRITSAYRADRGMTLIELMVVITIIAILAGLSTLSVDFIRRENVTSTTKEILAEIHGARMSAITIGSTATAPNIRGVGLRLISPNSYVIFQFNDCNANYVYNVDGCGGSSREEAGLKSINISPSIEIKRVEGGVLSDPSNDNALDIKIFDKNGLLRSANWDVLTEFVLVVQHKNANQHARCILIGTNTIREGHWNAVTNSCSPQ